ncbi:MAG: NADH-quinone oxidoreductase subunit NuoG [Burkholderiaceae bacterium]
MATIHIDNQPFPVDEHENLLQQCLSLGFDLPYFCWHPAMGSVGACRQCAVKQFKDEHDTKGKIVMACMVAAKDGTRISLQDEEARAFRAGITEWMMLNHPHDCPVCDEGGECHLQDMTVMTGHVYRRYRGLKRTFRNQDLGPLVNHEMNRCIQCYRCTRFYRDYAGGTDLQEFALRNTVYFGRDRDGTLQSEFSGNLVEVCPTGVFTDKSLKKHYTRKWDLQTAPSVCVHCSVGCNTLPGERYGLLRRVRNRYNQAVNGYFLCDRGRYGYEFVNSQRRLRQCLMRVQRDEPLLGVAPADGLRWLSTLSNGQTSMIGIGSPRASLESNFALRQLVGAERYFLGLAEPEHALLMQVLELLRDGPARTPSLQEVGHADAVLVLGEDVANTAPMIALALRQAVRREPHKLAEKLHIPAWDDHAVRKATEHQQGPLFVATPAATRIDDIATRTWNAAPADIARLGFAVAHALDSGAPTVAGMDAALGELADAIAAALLGAERPLIVCGTGCADAAVLDAAANVAQALCARQRQAALCLVVPECNSLGAALIGGASLDAAFQVVHGGGADVVVVLENDLYRRAPASDVDAFLSAARAVVVVDHLAHGTGEKADLVLPAAPFAESDGTLVNNEGRAQRHFQVMVSDGDVQESWRWMQQLAEVTSSGTLHDPLDANGGFDRVTAACARALPALAGIVDAAPSSDFRIDAQKIARQPHRYSGRTAMHANVSVFDQPPPRDADSPLAFSMEGHQGEAPPALNPRFWAPGWNSVQSLNKFQDEVGGALHGGNPGVRLIEPGTPPHPAARWRGAAPAPFERVEGEWLFVPLQQVFGSEELSSHAPGIAALSSPAFLSLGPDDASDLGLVAGDAVGLQLGGVERQLALRLQPELPRGVAGLFGIHGVVLPATGRLSKVNA